MPFLDTQIVQAISQQFFQISWLEWLGTVTGFICIYLAAKEHIWNWPVSIISVVAYAIVFYQNKLYGDAGLQIYFLGTAVYGWYIWLRKEKTTDRPIESIAGIQWLYVIAGIIILTAVLSIYLKVNTDTDVPYADGFCTAVSFIAQLLLTRKILQNWILWVVVDICYVPLYFHKHLALTAVLYIVLTIIAFMGYLDWKKTYREQQKH
jgi:nicotinamide mononucleotide transporter